MKFKKFDGIKSFQCWFRQRFLNYNTKSAILERKNNKFDFTKKELLFFERWC